MGEHVAIPLPGEKEEASVLWSRASSCQGEKEEASVWLRALWLRASSTKGDATEWVSESYAVDLNESFYVGQHIDVLDTSQRWLSLSL